MTQVAIVIPARYASVRLPGKPLLEVNNKTIIQWVYERAKQSRFAYLVVVATDNQKIYDKVKEFGGEVRMTSAEHQSGSDRIAEVIKSYPEIDIIVNVQGDEPLINPESIDMAVNALISDEDADMSTLIRKIENKEEVLNPNLVKVVRANDGKALYFSRAPIPYERKQNEATYYAHIGLYVYRREALLKMTELKQTELEKAECLEQLRALQNGFSIQTVEVDYCPLGIDTPEDFEEFKQKISEQSPVKS